MQRFQQRALLTVPVLLAVLVFISSIVFTTPETKNIKQNFTSGALPPPRFADPERARRLAAAFPEVERLFASWVQQRHISGSVVGILIDGELAW